MDRRQVKIENESDLMGQYDVEYEVSNDFVPMKNQDIYSCEIIDKGCLRCPQKCDIGYMALESRRVP